jgi:hypothetical protein
VALAFLRVGRSIFEKEPRIDSIIDLASLSVGGCRRPLEGLCTSLSSVESGCRSLSPWR